MKRLLSSLLFLPLLMTTACSLSDPRCAKLPGDVRYCLQPTTAVMPFDVQQKVELTLNGLRETMVVELEVDAFGMRFAGLTPFGQTLVQASYDNREARAGVLPDKRLEPVLFLAFLQLALWPADSVRAGLDATIVVQESMGQRRVLEGGNVVIEVSYTGGRPPSGDMRIVFPSAQLEIDVKTLNTQTTK